MSKLSINEILNKYSNENLLTLDIRQLLLVLEMDVSLLQESVEGTKLLAELPLEPI
ncbi:hypothetical protein [Acinetobacter seifertii]|uniref:hypothetical protein n=1 Tax=Acinetobacter seifertii TaxID=1530123 RepID=UPI00148B5D91|nr:hypothetical protein [Acinetobacter seifertii]